MRCSSAGSTGCGRGGRRAAAAAGQRGEADAAAVAAAAAQLPQTQARGAATAGMLARGRALAALPVPAQHVGKRALLPGGPRVVKAAVPPGGCGHAGGRSSRRAGGQVNGSALGAAAGRAHGGQPSGRLVLPISRRRHARMSAATCKTAAGRKLSSAGREQARQAGPGAPVARWCGGSAASTMFGRRCVSMPPPALRVLLAYHRAAPAAAAAKSACSFMRPPRAAGGRRPGGGGGAWAFPLAARLGRLPMSGRGCALAPECGHRARGRGCGRPAAVCPGPKGRLWELESAGASRRCCTERQCDTQRPVCSGH